ncbi:MAG: class I SAM-dependent methyltransferase, partial [Anaerolineae bacterium]|nr:class I SAM-dependent methyltransferase [Anaerolineae bacterium]
GDMWQALENVVPLVAEGGKLFIAIYNDQGMKSKLWRQIKFLYTRLPRMGQMLLVLTVGLYWEAKHFILHLLRGRNPLSFPHWNKKKKERGMAVWYDLVDWVGGYPFEVATPGEIFDFYTTRNFMLIRLITVKSAHGNNEFVFIKNPLPTV